MHWTNVISLKTDLIKIYKLRLSKDSFSFNCLCWFSHHDPFPSLYAPLFRNDNDDEKKMMLNSSIERTPSSN